jgi:hypothetical protein
MQSVGTQQRIRHEAGSETRKKRFNVIIIFCALSFSLLFNGAHGGALG